MGGRGGPSPVQVKSRAQPSHTNKPPPPPPRHPSSHNKTHALPNARINREREKTHVPEDTQRGGQGTPVPPRQGRHIL